jgi:hypothetical protein
MVRRRSRHFSVEVVFVVIGFEDSPPSTDLPLDFGRANLLRHELRGTVSFALKGCAILDRK